MNIPRKGDSNYDPMRADKTKVAPMTKKECIIANFHVARNMIKSFRYRPWMTSNEVIGPNGERIDKTGQIYIPKFKRKIND